MWLTRSLPVLFLILTSCRGQEDEEASGETTEFECPPGSDGFYPHLEYCDRYFECREGKLVKKRLCGDGLGFDPDKDPEEDPCDHIHNIKGKCKSRPKLQKPQPGDTFCPRQNGVYPSPDPAECDKFYSCLNGVGSPQQCADGLHFDPIIGTCVWARESSRKGCSLKSSTENPKSEASDIESNKDGESLPNGFKCPGGKLGVHPAFPHPESCRLYYVCLNGVTPNEAGCTSGLVFNKETGKCDDPENVPGCEETYGRIKKSELPVDKQSGSKSGPVDDETAEDLAKLLTLLSNPKLKTFLKPEIVNALGIKEDEKQETDEVVRVGSSPRQVNLSAGPFKRKKKPQVETAEIITEEAKVDQKDHDEGLSLVRPTRIPNRQSNFTSRFIPKVRPTLNRFRPRPTQQETQPDEQQASTTLPSIIEVFPEKTVELSTPETSSTSTTSTTTSATTTTTESAIEPSSTSPRTRLRFTRPNAYKGPSGQGFRRPKPTEDKTAGLKNETEPEKTEEEKKISDLKEEKIKNLLAEAANPNGQKKETQEDAPNDFHDFLTNFRKKKVQEGRDRFRPRPNLRVRPGKTSTETSTTTEATTTSTTTTTMEPTEAPTTIESVTFAVAETTTSLTTTTTSSTTTEIITESPTTIPELITTTTELTTTTTISTTSESPATSTIEPETTTFLFSFQPTRRPVQQTESPVNEVPKEEVSEIFQQTEEASIEEQQTLNDPTTTQQSLQFLDPLSDPSLTQKVVIGQQQLLVNPSSPQDIAFEQPRAPVPQEAVFGQQQVLIDPLKPQQPQEETFEQPRASVPQTGIFEQPQLPNGTPQQPQGSLFDQQQPQQAVTRQQDSPSSLQQHPTTFLQPTIVQQGIQSRPSSLPSSVITPPPLKADEQGQFEYVYYYEYEYEDDDKNGTNQTPKNTLPASLLNQEKPQPLPPIPLSLPSTTARTSLTPPPSPTTTSPPPTPIATRAPIVQITSQRPSVTSPKSLEAEAVQTNPKFPHFTSFPLLTDRPDGIVKPDIPKVGPAPALKSPPFRQELVINPPIDSSSASFITHQTSFNPEVGSPQSSSPTFTAQQDEDYDYSDKPLEEKPRTLDSFPVSQNLPQISSQETSAIVEAPSRPAVTNGILIQPQTPISSEPSTTTTTQSSSTPEVSSTTEIITESTTSAEFFTPSFLPTIPTQRPQILATSAEEFELNQFEVDQEALQPSLQQREPVGFPRPPPTLTTSQDILSTPSPFLDQSPPRAQAPIQAPPGALVRPTTSFESPATFDSFPQQQKPEPSKFVRFEDPDFLTSRPSAPTPFPTPAPIQQPSDLRGQPGLNSNAITPQSSSFFNFQRPQQPQLPANTFSPEQFSQQFKSQPQSTQFGRFPQQNQFPSFQQQSQFASSQQPQSQFSSFQQPQQNRFPSQPFTAFNNGNPPPARFAERPSPAIGPGSFSPGSQLQQAFFSVFPQRSQRAISQNVEVDGDDHHFPEVEFGGFVPLSDQHHQKQTDLTRPARDLGSFFKKIVKRVKRNAIDKSH